MFPSSIQNLITEFNKLPGIGSKTSQRFVFYLLKKNKNEIEKLTKALEHLKDEIKLCDICKCFTSQNPCLICSNPQRDKTTLCVVSETTDMAVIESTGEYKGLYHIINGLINTLDGITPDALNIRSLVERVKTGAFQEIILAFDPTIEGESTVLYLKKILEPYNKKITRLARGLPMGSDIEYADEITLSNALKGRNTA
ncbi:MAG: recombination mediator RecR [bacterium]